MTYKPPKSIVITGASSGIGESLAKQYAANGIFLYLSGRNKQRLDCVVADCEKLGARVFGETIDVTDRAAVETWISRVNDENPIDLIIANAGISSTSHASTLKEQHDTIRDIFDVNLMGVLNTVLPVIPILQKQGHGQIAIVSSLAGYRGLPSSPAYSASKAAVEAWGEALQGQLYHDGIRVNVIYPGFVTSRITDANTFTMPMIMPAEKAARIIQRGLEKNKAHIAFPWPMHFALWIMSIAPKWLIDPVLRRLPKKV